MAVACGGGSTATVQVDDGSGEGTSVNAADLMSTRTGRGIAFALGIPMAISGPDPCENPQAASGDPVKIAYVGGDVDELETLGLESLVLEQPTQIISAYINEINFAGGIHGRCIEFVPYLWSMAEARETFDRICAELQLDKDILLVIDRNGAPLTLTCATIQSKIPTIAFYAAIAQSRIDEIYAAGAQLFLDTASVETLFDNSIDVALRAEVISHGETIGLLHGRPSLNSAAVEQSVTGRSLTLATPRSVPTDFSNVTTLLAEKEVRLLEGDLSQDEADTANRMRAALIPEVANLFAEIERFYVEAAEAFQTAGVTTMVTTTEWFDVRRLMRAAELIDWTPRWILNDTQPANLVLTDAPERQARNTQVVSERRAPGDEISDLDRGCVNLRNTQAMGPTFSHRTHSDAWNLLQVICDFLDVAFAALTRVDGEITREAFGGYLALAATEDRPEGIQTPQIYGNDNFRVLQVDPACVLNDWGCLRSDSDDWYVAAYGSGTTGVATATGG